jgi:hypothetical protein
VRLEHEADLFRRLAIDGDDASEFIDEFARTFGVDTSEYRWYFHHGEEGLNFGGVLFPPPYRRVSWIPITLTTLVEAARTKRWPIAYPAHNLPKVRWDLRLNLALLLLVFAAMVLGLATRGAQ